MRALFITLFITVLNCVCFAQAEISINDVRNIYDEKGDYYFDRKKHKKAIVYYNMAYSENPKNYYSVLRKAEAYVALGLLDQAIECYKIVFNTTLKVPNENLLRFALLLLKNKDITGYEKYMGKYLEIVNDDIMGGNYISSAETRAKMYKDSSFVLVENENAINTQESEICPVVYGNRLVFASTRKKLDGSTGNSYYNLFASEFLRGGKLGKLNYFNRSLISSLSESSVSFNSGTNSVFFTRSKSVSSNLKVYSATIPNDSKSRVSAKEIVVGGISSVGHPAFTSNGKKMYFVAEGSDSKGGLDIYSSEFIGGAWSSPKNLGAGVNSNDDEMYPFVVNDTVLYFTSAGHKGYGGLDLYSYSLNTMPSSPKNLGSKVNSKYDDYCLSFTPGGLTGYFSSNRTGGLGEEDIYRIHKLDFKVKYAAYRFKRRSTMENDKINLYLTNGKEFNIASEDKSGFNFGFQPSENYKMVIQHEDVIASDIVNNGTLTDAQRMKAMLAPKPINRTDIRLQTGMRYQFTAGMKPLSNQYKTALEELSKDYQNTNSSAIDLTALAKELQLRKGEIYTVRFVKDKNQVPGDKTKEGSTLFVNGQSVDVEGNAFFIVLPLDIQVNFNIKTDIAHFKEAFNPKKVGQVKVDKTPVIKEQIVDENAEGFAVLVNTENKSDLTSKKQIPAKSLSIIPGSMYILTLSKTDGSSNKGIELVVPLTKGVKYNLGNQGQSLQDYNRALAQMAKNASAPNEELIDISVLSKELDILGQDNIELNLVPTAKFGSRAASNSDKVVTTLEVDGRRMYVTNRQKFMVKLQLASNKKMNIQTDLKYVKENFDASTIALKVDTNSFSKDVITDPVFDIVIVNFDLNKYDIRSDAKAILDNNVVRELKGDSRLYVTIKGYTDALGDAEYNKKLSKDRAEAVKAYLTSNGIGGKRIRTFSFGESLALKAGQNWEDLSEAELKKHRKVEIVIYLPK